MTLPSCPSSVADTPQEAAPPQEAESPPDPPTPLVPLTDIQVQLTGEDGNAFAILARMREALRRGGRRDLIEVFTREATSGDYDHLLQTCQRYVHCR